MLFHKRTFACIDIFFCVILSTFYSSAHADFDQREDKMLEERLHNIYSDHYSRPVLDTDWFKIVDAIQEQSYTVKSGDTLWGISKIYFGDGFYWSKLWSVNRNITNPHVIEVSDTLQFRSGSFSAAPSLAVNRVNEEASEEGEMAMSTRAGFDRSTEAYDFPETFKETPLIRSLPANEVLMEERPEIKLVSRGRLTQEILNRQPTVLGVVKTVGENRMATGESNVVVLERRSGLTEGSEVTAVNSSFSDVEQGYKIKVLARLRVLRAIDNVNYEAQVLEQYDGITEGSSIIDYQVREIDLGPGETEPINMPIKVIGSGDKPFWSNGDVIFLDAKNANPTVGDLINISNKFSPDVNLYYHSGVIKIVGVSAPYATGIVIYSRTILNKNSISTN